MSEQVQDQQGEKLYAGKYKSVEELEKAYANANDLISKGKHKEPAAPKQETFNKVELAKEIAKQVQEGIKAERVAQKEANAAAVKKLISSTPDAALSLKKALYTSDGKQEKEYMEKIEKGELTENEAKMLIEQGRDLEEPPSFLDKVLKEKGTSPDDYAATEEKYLDLLDNPHLYEDGHPDQKKLREQMFKYQDKLGKPREDIANLGGWEQGVQGEETMIDGDGR